MKSLSHRFGKPNFWRQRGSILVQTSAFLLVIVIALSGTELGYLFYVKREMQKAVDLSALAGAQALGTSGCAAGAVAATANATQNLQTIGFVPTITPICGTWNAASTEPQHFLAGGSQPNAMKVSISGTAPTLMPLFQSSRLIAAEAVAAGDTPLAALTVRSTLVSVDSTKSQALNAVFGGLLGGSLSLSAVSWDGLVKTEVNLLKYLDRLAINLGVAAGQYEALLSTNASVDTLLQTGIEVLQAGGGTGTVVADALNGLIGLRAAIPPGAPLLKLADLIKLQTGTPASGLDLGLNVFELAQGVVQLANSKNAVVADIPLVSVFGIDARVKLKVIEPPQLSAIGNPALAKTDPNGPNRIYVRTAQIRSLVSVSLPGLSGITNLLNSVSTLLSPVTSLLNNVLSLNLVETLTCVLYCEQTQTRVVLVPGNPIKLDINLDVGHGEARVTDYNCSAPASKSLTASASTAAVNLRVGQMTDTQRDAVFSSSAVPVVTPIPLLDVETSIRKCTLAILCSSTPWTKYSRTGLRADTSVLASSASLNYSNPPNLNAPPPQYQGLSSTNVVSSLSSTLNGLEMQTYYYDATKTNSLGNVIGTATQLVSTAISQVKNLVTALLSPLLDPLANLLLTTLGIDLAKTEVGGSLTCKGDARLVY